MTGTHEGSSARATVAEASGSRKSVFRLQFGVQSQRRPSGLPSRYDPEVANMNPIGYVRSSYRSTSEVPKGPGAQHTAEGVLEILPEYEPGLQDIEGFSHLYVIWEFDRRDSSSELVGTPPTDDRPHGVFATRSPLRPNPIGLTVVELLRREGHRLHVKKIDMLDGTPILDIKPYLSSVPDHELRRGWLAEAEARTRQTKT